MQLSKLFFKTFKEAPKEADIPSHQLLEQAGYIKRLHRGHYTYSPIMQKVLHKLKKIISEELEKEGASEIFMPQMHPQEIWEESGRLAGYKAEKLMFTLSDRDQTPMCLAPTHEEAVTHYVKNWITSYKQLPVNLYQFSNKFRDEIRPRFGLMRAKEFIMKDAYSFSANQKEMDEEYQKMRCAYQRILKRLELEYVIVQADSGKIGNAQSEEFQVLADIGEDCVLICKDFAFNDEKAPCLLDPFEYESALKELEKVSTPNIKTIDALHDFLDVSYEYMIKTVVYKLIHKDSEELVAVGIRSDREVNKVKCLNHFGALEIELAAEYDIKKHTGLDIGFIGPINCPITFVADHSCAPMTNFTCGANEKDFHFKNVNWERDLPKPQFADFCQAKAGDLCPLVPNGRYEDRRGIEVGHIFNLGDKYSEALKATFQSEEGKPKPFLMGCFGLGVGRLAQACVEQSYDDKGIIWPKALAPFQLMITAVNTKDEEQAEAAFDIYKKLLEKGYDVLLDDRKDRLGSKLKDSDLVGIRYKMIIGKQYFTEQKLEVEARTSHKELIDEKDLLTWAEKLSDK